MYGEILDCNGQASVSLSSSRRNGASISSIQNRAYRDNIVRARKKAIKEGSKSLCGKDQSGGYSILFFPSSALR